MKLSVILMERPTGQECPHCGVKLPDWFHEWYSTDNEQIPIYKGLLAADCPMCGKGVLLRAAVLAADPTVQIIARSRIYATKWLQSQRPGEFSNLNDFLQSGDEAAQPFINYKFREDQP